MTPALRLLLRCALVFTAAISFAGEGYPLMPQIAPIGERIAKYQDIPESALGPAVDAGIEALSSLLKSFGRRSRCWERQTFPALNCEARGRCARDAGTAQGSSRASPRGCH
jgi:hypothetical protein